MSQSVYFITTYVIAKLVTCSEEGAVAVSNNDRMPKQCYPGKLIVTTMSLFQSDGWQCQPAGMQEWDRAVPPPSAQIYFLIVSQA